MKKGKIGWCWLLYGGVGDGWEGLIGLVNEGKWVMRGRKGLKDVWTVMGRWMVNEDEVYM